MNENGYSTMTRTPLTLTYVDCRAPRQRLSWFREDGHARAFGMHEPRCRGERVANSRERSRLEAVLLSRHRGLLVVVDELQLEGLSGLHVPHAQRVRHGLELVVASSVPPLDVDGVRETEARLELHGAVAAVVRVELASRPGAAPRHGLEGLRHERGVSCDVVVEAVQHGLQLLQRFQLPSLHQHRRLREGPQHAFREK